MSTSYEAQVDPRPVDIRYELNVQKSVARFQLWEKMGLPTTPTYMTYERYMRDFRGRMFFANAAVAESAQMSLKTILCGECRKDEPHGAIAATQLFTSVEDDVMTVFPSVGHFLCHFCGFEEWHPLKHDPRVRMDMAPGHDANVSGLGQGVASMYGGAGLAPAMQPPNQRTGMTAHEQEALFRIYKQRYAKIGQLQDEALRKLERSVLFEELKRLKVKFNDKT